MLKAMKMSQEQMGVRRTALTLLRVNQPTGFDCPGCAWPDPGHTHTAEFCENGAKAVAEEATLRRVSRDFFAEHSIEDLAGRTDYWLGQQGRLAEPMYRPAGADHYEPIDWQGAFALIAERLHALPTPDAAAFYTSGRTSNEAAFLYQLMVRRFGTNNLPDCSNMCHESSGAALAHSIGIGKGSVLLEDIYAADLIMVVGQNPGTNHPRMLSALEQAKKNGGYIVNINPLDEAGLRTFHNPQTPKGLLKGADLTDDFLQVRLSGDQALFAAMAKLTVEAGAVDEEFIVDVHLGVRRVPRPPRQARLGRGAHRHGAHPRGDRAGGPALPRVRPGHRVLGDGPDPAPGRRGDHPGDHQPAAAARQHRQARCRSLCPVRGHSNVQGDRTMGVWEKAHDALLDGLRDEFGFEPKREHGLDSVDTLRAMHAGQGEGVLRGGRQLRRRDAGHHAHRTGDARPRPDRARLDQAQPLARGRRP